LIRRVIPRARRDRRRLPAWDYQRCLPWARRSGSTPTRTELVGHIAGTPFRAARGPSRSAGLNLHHAVTDPSRGGRGIFKGFVRAVLEAGARRGMASCRPSQRKQHLRRGGAGPAGAPAQREAWRARLGAGRRRSRDSRALERGELVWRLARPGARYRATPCARAGVFAPTRLPGAVAELGSVPGAPVSPRAAGVAGARPVAHVGRPRSRRSAGRARISTFRALAACPLNFRFFDLTGAGRRLEPTACASICLGLRRLLTDTLPDREHRHRS
jgi:hypothetical protein